MEHSQDEFAFLPELLKKNSSERKETIASVLLCTRDTFNDVLQNSD